MYDYDKLRRDLREYFLNAYHNRGYDKAIDELITVEFASCEELCEIAIIYGFDLDYYQLMEEAKQLVIDNKNEGRQLLKKKEGVFVFDNNYHEELCKLCEKKVDAEGEYVVLDNYNHIQFLVVSDTHIGNKKQQLQFLNQVYQEAYNRGVSLVLNARDLTDRYYPNRKDSINEMEAYFVDIYADRLGHIIDIEANPVFFGKDDVWEEAGKDRNKVKKLEIKNGIY